MVALRSSDAHRSSPTGSEDDDIEGSTLAVNPIGLPLSQLQKLMTKFMDVNGKMTKLTRDQFVDALSSNQPCVACPLQREQMHSELQTLFKKIDADCAEAVDWEEFTEYMLLHMPGLNFGEGSCELSQSPQVVDTAASGAAWGAGHSDMISSIAVIHDPSTGAGGGSGRRYVTAGRDGWLKVWHSNLTVHKAIDVGQFKGRWLTACCWMSKARRLAVATSNFRIWFFDSSFSGSPVTFIDHKDGTPLCLGYRESTESDGKEKELLMVGDSNGFVTIYTMDDDWTSFYDEKMEKPLPFKKKKPLRRQYHEGWVTKVGFVYELQAMVTCGLDGEINICDVHTNQRKDGRPPIRLHKKYGVHVWCWCGSHKFFASGGLDRQIIIWNPYTPMAMTHLQGHNAPIIDVQVNEAQHQLLSMSVDKVIKVWDIQHYRCISTFTDKTEYKPEDRLTCMAFDPELPGLVMCSNTLNLLPMSVKVETSRTHTAPIVSAIFNDVFNQIISGDSLGTVCVWDVRTGGLDFEFRRAHGDHKLTCMVLDVSKRRMFTAAEDGEVRLWNYSSGQHLKTFTMKQPSEINGLLWAQTALTSPEGPNTFIVALAWDRRIYVWPGNAKSTSGNAIEPKYVLEDTRGVGHTEDISCICGVSTVSGLLATGGDDGHVVFWKIQETPQSSAVPVASRLSDGCDIASKGGTHRGGVDGRYAKKKGVRTISNKTLTSGGSVDGDSLFCAPATPGMSCGKSLLRGSCMPMPIPGLGNEGALPVPGIVINDNRSDPKLHDVWPEELGLEEGNNLSVAGVERLIFLEHKDCLLSTHSDRKARLWSRGKATFLQLLDLEALSPRPQADATVDQPLETATLRVSSAGRAPVTALHTDQRENKWLFTGDQDGWARVWDLSILRPSVVLHRLPRLHEMQMHRQAITHLQHIELDGLVLVMSAALDWTIALSTLDGQRIGTFNGKSSMWKLTDQSTWFTILPVFEEQRAKEEEKGWMNHRRLGKAAAGNRHGKAETRLPGTPGALGMRPPRVTQTRARQAVPSQAHCGRGIFKDLTAVDRPHIKPDLNVATHENMYLLQQSARSA